MEKDNARFRKDKIMIGSLKSKWEIVKSCGESRATKVAAIIAFIFILLALTIITLTPPASGYEISIYDAYAWYFWFFILASITCGILILVYQSYSERKSNWWQIGLWIIIFSNAIFLSLPFFRGYFIYPSGDALTHLGSMKDIISTGYIGLNNFYPVVHLLGVNLLYFTGLSLGAVANILFVSWFIIYLLNIYLLASVITNRKQTLLILSLASPLVFSYLHVLIHPSMLSLFMIPLILYFYHVKGKNTTGGIERRIMLILLTIMVSFTHPVTSIFVIIIFLILIFSKIIYEKIPTHKHYITQTIKNKYGDYNIPLIMIVIFFMWYFSYAVMQKSFLSVYNFLIHKSELSLFNQQTSILEKAQLSTFQIIELFIYKYGGIFLYLCISIIAVIIVLKGIICKKVNTNPIIFTYTILFVVGIIFSVFSLFAFTGEFNPLRISRFFLIFSPILIGLVFYRFVDKNNHQHVRKINKFTKQYRLIIGLIILIIITVVTLSIFNVYGSQRTVELNWQVSKMDITGTEWFSDHQNKKIPIVSIGLGIRRFEDLIFGTDYPNSERALLDPQVIASHFGYDKNNSIAETLNFNDRYLLTSKSDKVAIKVIPKSSRFKARQYTQEDFSKLNADQTVLHAYDNGEFDVWRVNGKLK